MRISRTWLRPVLTAVLFPVALLGAMWILDATSGDEWLPWTKSKMSSEQVVRIAETECFRRYPGYEKFRPWHVKLSDGLWRITGTDSGLPWIISSHFDQLMAAVIKDSDGIIRVCGQYSDRW